MTYNGREVVVSFEYPPIPNRYFDYVAWIDECLDEDSCLGYGEYPDKAKADLIQYLWEFEREY